MRTTSIWILTCVFIGLSACKKDNPDPQGENGTAHVIYSSWVSIPGSQRDTTVDGTRLKIKHLLAPELTQSIIDNGQIQVYMRFLTTVLPLPHVSDAGPGEGPTKTNTVSFLPTPGRLTITRYTHDNTASIGFGTLQFRYVLISGGTPASAHAKNLDLNDYEAVQSAFNLPD